MPLQAASGSRAAPIPKEAVVGFASASTLLRQARYEGDRNHTSKAKRLGLGNVPDVHNSNEVIPQIKGDEVANDKTKVPLFRKPQSLAAELPMADEGVVVGSEQTQHSINDAKIDKQIVVKKPRKKKCKGEEEGQMKIKKTKVTKPRSSKTGTGSKKDSAVHAQARARVSETFNTLLPSQEEEAKAREEFRDLCLEKAIPLRRQWTPRKDTVQNQDSEAAAEGSSSINPTDASLAIQPPVARFGQLLGDFGLTKQATSIPGELEISRQEPCETPVKRKRVDVIQGIPVPLQAAKIKRTKSPKKKARTITEKATAPFVLADDTLEPSVLQYFGQSEIPVEHLESDLINGPHKPADKVRKKPARKVLKPRCIVRKKKLQDEPAVLSPEAAMKNAGNQEMVFGTSSQLARDESPTLIRNLQQAIQESTAALQQSQDLGPTILPAGKFRTSTAVAQVQTRNLWSSASRNFEGSLLEVETVDLSETPKPPKQQTEVASCKILEQVTMHPEYDEAGKHRNSDKKDLDNQELIKHAPPILEPARELTPIIPRSVAEATLRKRPSNRSPIKNASNSKADLNQMPNYQGFTDAQLSKEVAAYGFKAIKKRQAMIELLERCWERKISMALQDAQANLKTAQPTKSFEEIEPMKKSSPGKKRGRPSKDHTVSTVAINVTEDAPLKKPRGRPKKDPSDVTPKRKQNQKQSAADEFQPGTLEIAADEICDSSPPTPSPPRQRPSSRSSNQLQLTPRAKVPKKKSKEPPIIDRSLLFEQITNTVKTFPPTHDPQNLTFYEKMLMYDPIVIEDLAAWLNAQDVAVKGESEKVWYGLVKEWCNSKSVCCLWRENLRGGARGRW